MLDRTIPGPLAVALAVALAVSPDVGWAQQDAAAPAAQSPETVSTAESGSAATVPAPGGSASEAPSGPAPAPLAGPASDSASTPIAVPPSESAPASIVGPSDATDSTATSQTPDSTAGSPASDGAIVTPDFDTDDPARGALASMEFAGGVGSVATTSVRAANSLTAAGLHVAPRYMSRVGDLDVSALGGFVNFPATEGSVLGAQVSLQAKLAPGLVAIADMGPQTTVGARGPLWSDSGITLGWAAHYRSDIYFAAEPGFGLAQPGFGLMPGFPGGSSQGLELSLNSEYAWDAFRFYGSPLLTAMSNRTSASLVAGADYDFGPFTAGYGATVQGNVLNPGNGIVSIKPLEIKHSAGIRLSLTDWAYLQANYHLAPTDTYGFTSQTVLAGVGTRLLGSFAAAPVWTIVVAKPPGNEPGVEPASEPDLSPEPGPEPEAPVEPELAAVPRPALPTPLPGDYDSLIGRISHSFLSGGKPEKPLTVALKKKGPKGWANAPQTTKTDAHGNYIFHRLPDGQYQAVYRNEKVLTDVVGAAVSHAVAVKLWRTATASIDVAWDESKIRGTIRGNTVEVEWPAKPGVKDTVYEVILKYSPEKPFVVGSPPSPATRAKFEVSDEVKGRTLYYTVKYWRNGGEFWGSNYYGQSNYKVLEVVK